MSNKVAHSGLEAREQTGTYSATGDIFRMTPDQRVQLIRQGIPARRIDALCASLDIPKELLVAALGLAPTTISRKARSGTLLSSDETERVLGVEYILSQIRFMTSKYEAPESDGKFDSGRWLGWWLTTPLPALGAEKPLSYFDTIEGQKYISNLLSVVESGAYV